jgi:hypothetical protein
LSIDTTSELANDANLLVGAEPVGSCYKTLGANGCRDTGSRSTGAVTLQSQLVEIRKAIWSLVKALTSRY